MSCSIRIGPVLPETTTQPLSNEQSTQGPALEIVIVTSPGGRDLLRAALESLREHPYTLGETLIHVVDNASNDGTDVMVRQDFPKVRLRTLDWNAGFCIANNVALREVTAPYVLVLNPDTEAYPGTLDHMVRLMEERLDIGMSSCRLEMRDGTLDHAAKRSFPTPLSSLSHFVGLGNRFGGRFAEYQAPELDERGCGTVDAINGAWMLVRKATMDEVGPFDIRYWTYMEDLDWCYRCHQHGWKVWYEGSVSYLHIKGGTTKKKRHRGLKTNWAFHRSMGRYYRKFQSGHNTLFDLGIYAAILGKFSVAFVRATIARRSVS